MKVLGLGFNGYLGSNFMHYKPKSVEVISSGSKEIDVTSVEQIIYAFRKIKPEVVINCAAITNEDWSEVNKHDVYEVNFMGAVNVAHACKEFGIRLVHIDTCFSKCPTNDYAYAKYAAHKIVLKIVPNAYVPRIGWLFGGINSSQFDTLVMQSKNPLGITVSHFGSPTYIKDAVDSIYQSIESFKEGLEDVANSGKCNRWEFCQHLMQSCGLKNIHYPVKDFTELAVRPLDCSLNGTLCFWKEAIDKYAKCIR